MSVDPALALAAITAIGALIKSYFLYKEKQEAKKREHELRMLKAKSDAALRASIVGIERHKNNMPGGDHKALMASIQNAALEESAEELMNTQVMDVTKYRGTQFYRPKDLDD